MGPVSRLRALRSDTLGSAMGGALSAARLVGLAALVWAAADEHLSDGAPQVPIGWLIGAAVSWIGWLAGRRRSAPSQTVWTALALLAGTGGAVAGYAPVGIGFPAVAALGAAFAFDAAPAVAIGVIGVGAIAATALAISAPLAVVAEGALATVAALLGGASRRQYQDRATQAEQILAERVRADAERDRAAALAERNRVGREVHDVLAHSLGALSVQLDAADAVLEHGADVGRARELVQHARRLAVDGLAETRRAVHALRGGPVELAEQLASLAAVDGAQLTVGGISRSLDVDSGMALYRAAQEAVTNARKHAPGAAVSMRLDFETASVVLVISNGPCPNGATGSELGSSGGGFGLRGMRERIESLGGHVVAEPSEPGWTVRVAVPLRGGDVRVVAT